MAELGVDYEQVRPNPDVIYVNAPGYGVDRPDGNRPAYAPSIGAAAGIPLANVGVSASPGQSIDEIKDGGRVLIVGG